MKSVLGVLIAITLGALYAPAAPPAFAGMTASYTYEVAGGTAPANTSITTTAWTSDSASWASGQFYSGLTAQQIRDAVKSWFDARRMLTEAVGTNKLILLGAKDDGVYYPVLAVDVDDDKLEVTVALDLHAERNDGQPGNRKIIFRCRWINADAANPGTIQVQLNSLPLIGAALAGGDTPVQAATKLAAAFTAGGFVVSRDTTDVTLDWDNATNLSKLGSTLDAVYKLANGAGGPHLQLVLFPTTGVIPTLTEWGLIILAVLAVGWVIWTVVRRRRVVVAA